MDNPRIPRNPGILGFRDSGSWGWGDIQRTLRGSQTFSKALKTPKGVIIQRTSKVLKKKTSNDRFILRLRGSFQQIYVD
eukprot:scaffold15955_cov94-Phaeocystis_antarctica.AAC.2